MIWRRPRAGGAATTLRYALPWAPRQVLRMLMGSKPSVERAQRIAISSGARCHAGAATGEEPVPQAPQPVVDAAVRFAASTPCGLALLPLEDALGMVEQPNLPGTVDEHPIRRRRLPGDASALLDTPAAATRLKTLRERRTKKACGRSMNVGKFAPDKPGRFRAVSPISLPFRETRQYVYVVAIFHTGRNPKTLAVTDLVTAETTSSLTSALALHFG